MPLKSGSAAVFTSRRHKYRLLNHRQDGEVLARIELRNSNVWEEYAAPAAIPDGKQAVYLTYRGGGSASLLSFTLL